MKALGMIEVSGYLAEVEAADAALKAANVTLIGIEIVKAGISNVQITGDIGAVQASVDAGKEAAENLGLLRAFHVIPRPNEELLKLFPDLNNKKESKPSEKIDMYNNKSNDFYTKDEEKTEISSMDSKDKKINDEKQSDDIAKEIAKLEKTLENYKNKKEKALKEEKVNYNNMKVETLRDMVRNLKLTNMNNNQIKKEKKETLIKILQEYDEKGDK